MPFLSIETNQNFEFRNLTHDIVLTSASKKISEMLGKPESYVMVSLRENPHMCFAGTRHPLAYVELKSLGLPEEQTTDFAQQLCQWLGHALKIPAERVYIEFFNGPRHLWGWNNATF